MRGHGRQVTMNTYTVRNFTHFGRIFRVAGKSLKRFSGDENNLKEQWDRIHSVRNEAIIR